MGAFEMPNFAHGTEAVAKALAETEAEVPENQETPETPAEIPSQETESETSEGSSTEA